ncbi:hypothetical protein GALMADRAFT_104297 [Galerina marginata CBS 339.88]|uniref:Arrestin C-terminal-like domain-containing protein n=1 Tax=Galerina marginata (strain CBS 339.88) TaxID=685588 RepID=A0A067SNP9_GALM3|nr:hypothetical protein GALMADRAFT_104297 [Galerina marginata CBS 339.88]
MAQVKLNLQPPPNIDFVIGYPGIPPGPDRPQASVKGAIELRTPPQGVKAKWVRIELRKVETLPGGGPANTFYDFVGPSPVNLWNMEDYNVLRSQDFPFSIRIPESIPPTISLDNRAGIGYELVASVCTKGKRGFLRKAKSVVTSTTSPIIIDKHELHSTWPVYCQPETRHLAQEGVNLIVERTNNCYGPGDRVAVIATVKSDSLHTVILRGFEFSLKEATVFRAGVHAPGGRRNAPQVKQVNIAENKVAVNATLYGGTSHTSELTCMISSTHTTTTLNAARHIDVTYTLVIKALMGTGTHLIMELPVIVSNWERHVSLQAISQIGPAPGLSIMNPALGAAVVTNRVDPSRARSADVAATTLPTQRSNIESTYGGSSSTAFNTVPAKTADVIGYGTGFGAKSGNGLVDEFGSTKPAISTTPSITASTISGAPAPAAAPAASNTVSTTGGRRPGSAGGGGGGTRFTVTNALPQEISQENFTRQRSAQATGSGSGSGSGSAGQQKQWPSAEEEKKLYEQARIKVARTQGEAASPPPAVLRDVVPPQAVNASPPRGAAAATTPGADPWLTAQEEKRRFQQAQAAVERAAVPVVLPTAQEEKRLFQQAQAAVERNARGGLAPVSAIDEKRSFQQAQAAVERAQAPPSTQTHTRDNSDPKTSASGTRPSASELYAQAIKARSGGAVAQAPAGGSSAAPPKSVPQYLTAEQEKAALRRYEEAKRAVDRTQNSEGSSSPSGNSGPIAYESLFPGSSSVPIASSSHPPPAEAPPPPFDSVASNIPEKERLRRAYEAQDAADLAQQNRQPSPPPPAAYPGPPLTPAPAGPSLPGQYANALEEKEAMRRKFEARDNAQARVNPAPQTPPRANSNPASGGSSGGIEGSSSPGRSPSANAAGFRPTPVPPGGSRVLTAAEEKALLRAKYEARDSGNRKPTPSPVTTNGVPPLNGSSGAGPTTPPPLMPRPPVEYIKETQEEDARLSRLNGEVPLLDGATRKLNGTATSSSHTASTPPSGANSLDMKPFTPFRAGFETSLAPPGPPPPLPPKPAGD